MTIIKYLYFLTGTIKFELCNVFLIFLMVCQFSQETIFKH